MNDNNIKRAVKRSILTPRYDRPRLMAGPAAAAAGTIPTIELRRLVAAMVD